MLACNVSLSCLSSLLVCQVEAVRDEGSAFISGCILLPWPVAELVFAQQGASRWTSLVLLARCFHIPGVSVRATSKNLFAGWPPSDWHARALRLLSAPEPQGPSVEAITPARLRQVAHRLRQWTPAITNHDTEARAEVLHEVKWLTSSADVLEGRQLRALHQNRHERHSAQRLLSAFQA